MSTTAEVRRGSAYPAALDELLPRARALAARLGGLPSRNALMRELKVGAEKAKTIRDELASANVRQPAGTVTELPTARPVRPAEGVTQPRRAVASSRRADPDETAPTGPAAGGAAPAAVDAPRCVDVPATRPVARPVRSWPVLLLALPAFVAIWSGWVGLGGLTGFGVVHPLPGIWDSLSLNTAITLPIGMETYAAFALRAWLSGSVPARARRFARWSAIAALVLGAAGQVAYHLMSAAGVTAAPWWITTVVACLPVAVLGMGAALAHLLREADYERGEG